MTKRLLLACLLALLTASNTARADTFFFTSKNFTNTTVSSPYASVTITGDTGTGMVTFTLSVLSNPASMTHFGFNPTASIASDFAMSFVSGTPVGNTTNWSPLSVDFSQTMDGYGTFSERVGPSTNSAGDRLTSYTVKAQFSAGKFGEALASNFENANSSGQLFALEYFPNSGNTGFVGDATPGGAVPGPSGLIIAASGLAVSGLVRLGSTALRRLNRRQTPSAA